MQVARVVESRPRTRADTRHALARVQRHLDHAPDHILFCQGVNCVPQVIGGFENSATSIES